MPELQFVECYPFCHCEGPQSQIFGLTLGFWSSFAYFLAGILLFRRGRRKSLFEAWVFSVFVIGGSSLTFHSTFSLASVALDYASVAFSLSLFLVYNFFKGLSFGPRRRYLALLIYYLVLWAIFFRFPMWERVGICVLIFSIALWDIFKRLEGPLLKQRSLLISLFLGITAFSAFLLEESKIWCDPSLLLQGHTLWHILGAASLYFYGRWRFPKL